METSNTFRASSVTWHDLERPTPAQLETLKRDFPFVEAVDLADMSKFGERPHLERREHYTFLVLLFPLYNRATREIEPAEIDFLITKDQVVTIHDGRLPSYLEIRDAVAQHQPIEHELLASGAISLLVSILERLLSACNPMLDHISQDLRTLEKNIFNGREQRKTVREILLTRRNITDFRKIMQTHKNTLKKLAELIQTDAPNRRHELGIAVESLVTRTRDIWDHLESFKESVVDLHKTNESLMSDNLNHIMKNYSTMSVVIFAMTLVAAIFAIDAGGKPLAHNPIGFWIVAALLVLVGLGVLEYFRRRKWL